jgi:hypothetical protein
MVLKVEDERDVVTYCGCDVGGREGKLAVGTDLNREICWEDGGGEGGEGNGSKGEMHLDCLLECFAWTIQRALVISITY